MSLSPKGIRQSDNVHHEEERIQDHPEPVAAHVAGDHQRRTTNHVRQVGKHQVGVRGEQCQRTGGYHTAQSTYELKPEDYWVVLEVVFPVFKDAFED